MESKKWLAAPVEYRHPSLSPEMLMRMIKIRVERGLENCVVARRRIARGVGTYLFCRACAKTIDPKRQAQGCFTTRTLL